MNSYEAEKARNTEAYERLKSQIEAEYRGQYVAIADGRLICVSPSFDEASEAAKEYRHAFVFEAGDEPILGEVRGPSPRLGKLKG